MGVFKGQLVAPALFLLAITACFAAKEPRHRRSDDASPVHLEVDDTSPTSAALAAFLDGEPEDQEAHIYSSKVRPAPHTASGEGLYRATTGVPASFTIQLRAEETIGQQANGTSSSEGDSGYTPANWTPVDSKRFIYVWIAGKDQIFIAEVTPNEAGGSDGRTSLTATYTSDFPGEYLVHVEEVLVSEHGEGRPIVGSPFSLTITGDDSDGSGPTTPTLDIDSLPVCGSEEDTRNDIADTFWRPGTWLSANVASPTHGVTRNGWVFQPKNCVFDAFSYEDLMLLASLEEPTWLLVLGGSVQRGLFLTLVDMVLAQGQKDNLMSSTVQKCWGYADIRVGNLRVTYQDMRLYRMDTMEDSVVCNNEKLISGSTSAFVRSCQQFLSSVIFQDTSDVWPSVIMAPSNLVQKRNAPNLAIEVLMAALPASWKGKLMFVDHMAGFAAHWRQKNPTKTALKDVGIMYHNAAPSEDNGLGKFDAYQQLDSRVTFMSAFPMYQAKLFENQNTRDGIRKYGSSVHYHYVSNRSSSPETYGGARMVQSTMTDMLGNIMFGKVVGTKAALYARANTAAGGENKRQNTKVEKTFQVCWDCPDGLLPFHVKAIPDPVCETVEALSADGETGEVWDGELCPAWCMEKAPVSQSPTESGFVDVRECDLSATAAVEGNALMGHESQP